MNSVSDLHSNGLQNQGNYSSARVSSQELAVNSYESLEAGLTIQTREGDVVTLSASSFSEMDAYEYSSRGEVSSKHGQVQASYTEREITLTTGESFSFSVQGDLNEQELADIEAIVKGIDEIIGEMAEGDMGDAISKAMSMGTYDSVSMYEADISVERSYAMYSEARSASYDRLGRGRAEQLPATEEPVAERAVDAGMTFLDKVAELLEAQEEEALARAQQPLSQLFDHHIKTLEEVAEEDEEAVEEPAAYSALELAAREVDQMINDMIKDIFENTLNKII
jgi:putative lipoic acid-binding regulatory protein